MIGLGKAHTKLKCIVYAAFSTETKIRPLRQRNTIARRKLHVMRVQKLCPIAKETFYVDLSSPLAFSREKSRGDCALYKSHI